MISLTTVYPANDFSMSFNFIERYFYALLIYYFYRLLCKISGS